MWNRNNWQPVLASLFIDRVRALCMRVFCLAQKLPRSTLDSSFNCKHNVHIFIYATSVYVRVKRVIQDTSWALTVKMKMKKKMGWFATRSFHAILTNRPLWNMIKFLNYICADRLVFVYFNIALKRNSWWL